MAKGERVYNSTDAAGIKPKFIPNAFLQPRDDSGGPEWDPHTAQFGDGGFVVGGDEKGHLATSGKGHDVEGTQLSDRNRTAGYDRLPYADKHRGDASATARAKKEAME